MGRGQPVWTVLQWGLPVCDGWATGRARQLQPQPHCVPCPVRQRKHDKVEHTDRPGGGLLASVPPRGPSQPPGVRSWLLQRCGSSPAARWQTGERERTLTCVGYAISVDVMSPDTVYVGELDSGSVHVVSITADRKTATLEKPDTVRDEPPLSLAVLGDSVMVGYGVSTLVIYRHSSPAPVRVIPHPAGLERVTAVSTDCHSNYIVTDSETRSIFMIDADGNLCHTVNIPHADSDADSRPQDCAVVNRQLWVGCDDLYNGDIVIMSSR